MAKYKVAVTDFGVEEINVEKAILEPLGCEVVGPLRGTDAKDEKQLSDLVKDADHVITQFSPVTAAVIGAMRKSKIIVRYGIGVDNVDLKAAAAKNIPVCNVPDYCIDEVADSALAMILDLVRKISAQRRSGQVGQMGLGRRRSSELFVLSEMTVGVVGFGRIGREVATAAEAVPMQGARFRPGRRRRDGQGCGLHRPSHSTNCSIERSGDAALPEQRENQAHDQCRDHRQDEEGRDAGEHVARHAGEDRRPDRRAAERANFCRRAGRDRSRADQPRQPAGEDGQRDHQFAHRLGERRRGAQTAHERGEDRRDGRQGREVAEHRQRRECVRTSRLTPQRATITDRPLARKTACNLSRNII